MIFQILLVLLAFPVGLLVAYMARDELVDGRKWFIALIIIFALVSITLFSLGKNTEGFSSLFIVLSTSVSYYKSFDKKWTRKS